MLHWLVTVVLLLLVDVGVRLALAAATDDLDQTRSGRAITRAVRRLRRPRAEVVPLHRPVELVCADLRRLHDSFHRDGMRFAKYEGCRLAYDRVLAEAADMMGSAHLLELLPPGPDRDRERARVELLLRDDGLLPPLWAA